MPIKWNDSLATGVRQIDLQHQELIEIINELDAAHAAGYPIEPLHEILSRLRAYVLFHFGTEESLLSEVTAPAHAKKHLQEHGEFAARIQKLDSRRVTAADVDDLIDYLERWLVEHIMKTDREMGRLILDQTKIERE